MPRRGLRVRYGLALDVSAASAGLSDGGGTKQADKLVVCPPMFAHDVDRIEENLQGDGFFALEIRVEIGKRNVQRSGKTLFVPRTSKARRTVGSVTDSGGLLIRRSAVNKQYAPSGYYSEHPQRVQRIVHEPLRQRARWLISRERPPRANEPPVACISTSGPVSIAPPAHDG